MAPSISSWLDSRIARMDSNLSRLLTERWRFNEKPKVGPDNEEQLLWLVRLSYCTMVCTGMIDAICVWGMTSPAPSGQSGNIRNFSSGVVGPTWYKSLVKFSCIFCFVLGVIVSGIWTNQKENRTLMIASRCILLTGFSILFVAVIVSHGEWPEQREVMYGACWAMGLQGGMMKATTGFADTTGVSGTLTDIGLIIGQAANPANRSKKLASKLTSLVTLVASFILGAFLGAVLLVFTDFANPKEKTAGDKSVAMALMVPGSLLVLLGLANRYIAVHKLGADADESTVQLSIIDPVARTEHIPHKHEQGCPSHKQDQSKSLLDPSADTSLCKATAAQGEASTQPAQKDMEGQVHSRMRIDSGRPPAEVQKFVDEQKDAMVRTALIAAFLTGAANYVVTDIISRHLCKRGDSVSHISGPVYRLSVGLADLVTFNEKILLKGQQASNFVVPGVLTIAFWSLGAITSGIITKYPTDKTYRTGAAIMIVVGSTLLFFGALGGLGVHYIVPTFCFSFGLLNGTMSATTGFARTGHFTGMLMNIGLLFGQLSNQENDTPEIWWKLQQSCKLVLCWASGTAVQSLVCRVAAHLSTANSQTDEMQAAFAQAWVHLMLIGIGFVLLGCLRLRLRAIRIKTMIANADEGQYSLHEGQSNADTATRRKTVAHLLDAMVLEDLQCLGVAGGFTFDHCLFPTLPQESVRRATRRFTAELRTFPVQETLEEETVVSEVSP